MIIASTGDVCPPVSAGPQGGRLPNRMPVRPAGGVTHSVTATVCNTPLAACGGCGSRLFLAALHARIIDRIAWPWARDWLASHAHLGLAVQAGWPVLRLILDTPPPDASLLLLQRHYREAAITGRGAGPLADLAASLEVVEVAR